MIELEAHGTRIRLVLRAIPMGRDLCVMLTGGHEHLGAVALSQPRPSHSDPAHRSATTSVLVLPGHREDDMAKKLSARLASALDVHVVVACGIHLDDILPEEIQEILHLAEQLGESLITRLGKP